MYPGSFPRERQFFKRNMRYEYMDFLCVGLFNYILAREALQSAHDEVVVNPDAGIFQTGGSSSKCSNENSES